MRLCSVVTFGSSSWTSRSTDVSVTGDHFIIIMCGLIKLMCAAELISLIITKTK